MALEAKIDSSALDALFAPYDSSHSPGFAVGVALKGKPGYRRGFGMASVELPVTLSPTIRMRIGSTSKHFCVLSAMLLAEAGKLSIDDSPRRFLPELPQWADAITIRQLMAHISGMRDSLDLMLLAAGPGKSAEADDQFRLLASLDSVNFAPGASWNYNNGGYVLLSVIVERLSGMSLADFMRTRIFEPVGMCDTQLRLLDTELLPNSATLHVPNSAGGWTRGIFGPPVAGEGGIVSTVDDMLRWLAHMSNPVVGSAATWSEMRTPHATHGYGLGLTTNDHRGLATVHHAGGVIGGSSQMLKVIDHDLDLILITNGQSALDMYNLVDAIIDACIPGLPAVPTDATIPAFSGTFFSPTTGKVLTLVEHEGKQAMTVGGMTLPARRDADGVISVAILPTDLVVVPARAGDDVVSLTSHEFGNVDLFDHVEPPLVPDVNLLPGRYESKAAGLSANVTISQDGALTVALSNKWGNTAYGLMPIGPALWQATAVSSYPMTFTIETDPDGFRLSNGRTERLRFERAA